MTKGFYLPDASVRVITNRIVIYLRMVHEGTNQGEGEDGHWYLGLVLSIQLYLVDKVLVN